MTPRGAAIEPQAEVRIQDTDIGGATVEVVREFSMQCERIGRLGRAVENIRRSGGALTRSLEATGAKARRCVLHVDNRKLRAQ